MMYKADHLSLVVKDSGRSADFYSQVLGCTIIDSFSSEALKIVYLQSGTLTIELLEYCPAQPTQRGAGIYDHIAFAVPDIEQAVMQLKGKGLQFESDSPRLAMSGQKIIFFSGPDNERIELIES